MWQYKVFGCAILMLAWAAAFEYAGNVPCKNQLHGCRWWSKFCKEPVFKTFMTEKCAKTCNFCTTYVESSEEPLLEEVPVVKTETKNTYATYHREPEQAEIRAGECLVVASSNNVANLATANADLTMNMYRAAIQANTDSNLFFSPTSITILLAMLAAGARGETASQIKHIIAPRTTDEVMDSTYMYLMSQINAANKPYQLDTANAVYIERSFKVMPDFVTSVESCYNAEVEKVDFHKNYDAAREAINDWVESKTNNKITDLLPDGSVDPLTRIVLVNAIYFKANWKIQFDAARTSQQLFHTEDDSDPTVPMMTLENQRFRYFENSEVQVVALPYRNNELSMYIILPRESIGLRRFEIRLDGASLQRYFSEAHNRKIRMLQLPKFKMEFNLPLKRVLDSVGMHDMFSHQVADFSGISGNRHLYVSGAFHRAFIEVNEEGTEAAAASAASVSLVRSGGISDDVNFIADRPFMYAIVHHGTNFPLFVGRMMKP